VNTFWCAKACLFDSHLELNAAIGPRKCAALPAFHALTGCDTVSCLHGKGKNSAWSTWNSYPELTGALLNLTCVTDELDNIMNLSRTDMIIYVLERFIILMFDRTSECTDLDSARKQLS